MIFDCVAAQTKPTFENAIVPIAMQENEACADICLVSLLQYVSDEKDIRIASAEADKRIEMHRTELYTREDAYKAVQVVYNSVSEMSKLEDEDRRLVRLYERRFRDHGLGLDNEKRKRLAVILNRLTELEARFMSNINENDTKVLFTRQELNGLNSAFFGSRETRIDADDGGLEKFVVAANQSEYFSILGQAKLPETRKRMYAAYNTVCPDNAQLLQEAIKLRMERAQLLGYQTHAEFVIDELVAQKPENVLEMLEGLKCKMKDILEYRIVELESIKRIDMEHANKPYDGFYSWDISYYSNLNHQLEYGYDVDEVKEYFPIKNTIDELLGIFQKMLGVRIIRAYKASVWHPDVEAYEVWEKDEPTFVGHFYLDLYARKSKYANATMMSIRPGYQRLDGSREYPAAVLLAGFAKPAPSRPTLLDQDDLEAFMHEMGHVFHEICSLTKWSKFHGTRVEHDFSEAPSQLHENWCWEPSVLIRISSHYETGCKIPSKLVQTMVKARNDNALVDRMSNIFYSLYDLAIHNTTDAANIDVVELYNAMRRDISLYNDGDLHTFGVATVDHYMDGYDAKYYSYLWSEVYSADMFGSRFLKEGLDNEQTGADYRREILRPGASRDPMLSLELFLGRKPSSDMFLRLLTQQQTPLSYEPAKPRFAVHKAVYAVNPVTCAPERLFSTSSSQAEEGERGSNGYAGTDDASHINILIMPHEGGAAKEGMVWVWAQITQGRGTIAGTASMGSLALGMPPRAGFARTSASQLLGAGVDDPTTDIARRLSTKFKRPIYLSLNNVSNSSLASAAASAAASGLSASAVSPVEELTALERCLFMELKQLL
ncbi:metalloendopeptidase [Coemansia sp. RSA 1933]|nr:metalloendopeptidase [Coemansia sp. RSA 1933]